MSKPAELQVFEELIDCKPLVTGYVVMFADKSINDYFDVRYSTVKDVFTVEVKAKFFKGDTQTFKEGNGAANYIKLWQAASKMGSRGIDIMPVLKKVVFDNPTRLWKDLLPMFLESLKDSGMTPAEYEKLGIPKGQATTHKFGI